MKTEVKRDLIFWSSFTLIAFYALTLIFYFGTENFKTAIMFVLLVLMLVVKLIDRILEIRENGEK